MTKTNPSYNQAQHGIVEPSPLGVLLKTVRTRAKNIRRDPRLNTYKGDNFAYYYGKAKNINRSLLGKYQGLNSPTAQQRISSMAQFKKEMMG